MDVCAGRKQTLRPRQREGERGGQSRKRVLLDELRVCSKTKNLRRGQEIHAEAMERGLGSCIYFATALVKMYTKCGRMLEARQIFDGLKHPDVVAWNALILGYAENEEGSTALDLFQTMKLHCAPNSVTFIAAVKACTALAEMQSAWGKEGCLQRGKKLHSEAGCHVDMYVQCSLISLYSACGSMADAQQMFQSIKDPDVVSWNALILGYAENGEGVVALDLFQRMKYQGCTPNSLTFVAALKACSLLGQNACLERGKEIHSQIACELDMKLQNTLIDMYAKCDSMINARQVFDSMKRQDVVSWTVLILGYAENGEGARALNLFQRMRSQGYVPNSVTFVAALKACGCVALDENESGKAECLEHGTKIHAQIGCHSNIYVQNTLIDMYSKCGSMTDARQVFESLEQPDVISWNALITGYAENGESVTALDLFAEMKSRGYVPNTITFIAALKACGLLGALQSGRKIHGEMDIGTEADASVVTSLVDFYAKCGDLCEAQKVFESHPGARSVRTWTALLAGYSSLGDTEAVFRLFEGMQDAGFQPDSITFLCILTCCSRAGLVDKGMEVFEAMPEKFGISPVVEHYNCMVDVLGRSNKLEDAMALLQRMPWRPASVTWMTVLGACHKWRNAGLGSMAFQSIVALDGTKPAAFLVMARIYGSRGMWREQQMLLSLSKGLEALEEAGQTSWTSEAGEVHTFFFLQ